MSVVVVVLGVGVCTVTDVKVNAKGFLCACVAVLSTSLQQIVSISVIFHSVFLSCLKVPLMLKVTCTFVLIIYVGSNDLVNCLLE